jgi:transglutaminase-like putative cysteine protease
MPTPRNRLVLQQTLRYDYPSPIRRLHHQLMVLPPASHGDQVRISSSLDVDGARAEVTESVDRFGNIAVDIRAARVQASIEFVVRISVERGGGPPAAAADAAGLLDPTALTEPDAALTAVASVLLATGDAGWALADRINAWVAATMRYRHDVTDVATTAAEALAGGLGVCQDYAHVMLALCRLCGLPARYVSGHLVGEGGSHAWVEVLLPSAADPAGPVAVAFDPTNDRRAGPTYLTIAVGRDYADVAPTHGSYSGRPGGRLSSCKSLEQEAVELVPA